MSQNPEPGDAGSGKQAAEPERIAAATERGEAAEPPDFVVYKSEIDGVTVVHVDTYGMPENDRGPIIRVYLNDEVLFENPAFPGTQDVQSAEEPDEVSEMRP